MRLTSFFWNDDENRFRSAWRIVIVFILFAVILTTITLTTDFLKDIYRIDPNDKFIDTFLSPFSALLATIVSIFLVTKGLDSRNTNLNSYQVGKNWIYQFSFGLFFGGVLITLFFLFELLLGYVEILEIHQILHNNFLNSFLIIGFGHYILVGFFEEILFRGYFLKNFAEGFNFNSENLNFAIISSLLISSVIFSSFHFISTNYNFISFFNIMIIGVLLGISYIITGQLALAIGIHISWNFFMGYVYGFPVSGKITDYSVFLIDQKGPSFIVGDSFGPEGGILSLVLIVSGLIILILGIYLFKRDLFTNFQRIATFNSN